MSRGGPDDPGRAVLPLLHDEGDDRSRGQGRGGPEEGLDKIAEEGLKALKVPGLAIAVIKDDKVVYARGFGYKDVEKKLPVTPDTIFAIGSSSKAFTVFALGKIVDKGKVKWDKPVRNYIPWFRLYDKDAGDRLTVRDLVTHRSGLPSHDLVWYNNLTISREELVRRLAYLQPSADLREKFQYNNLMFLTAGYLLETLTGKRSGGRRPFPLSSSP